MYIAIGGKCFGFSLQFFFYKVKMLYQSRDDYNLEPMKTGGWDDRTNLVTLGSITALRMIGSIRFFLS